VSTLVLVLLALVFLEGCLLALAPAIIKRMIASATERALQIAGLVEAMLALALLLLIYT
jgi:uncharacterized protein YjeT (DUF2065 family)